jgi:hypothetical protein
MWWDNPPLGHPTHSHLRTLGHFDVAGKVSRIQQAQKAGGPGWVGAQVSLLWSQPRPTAAWLLRSHTDIPLIHCPDTVPPHVTQAQHIPPHFHAGQDSRTCSPPSSPAQRHAKDTGAPPPHGLHAVHPANVQPDEHSLFYNFPLTQILTQHRPCSSRPSWDEKEHQNAITLGLFACVCVPLPVGMHSSCSVHTAREKRDHGINLSPLNGDRITSGDSLRTHADSRKCSPTFRQAVTLAHTLCQLEPRKS